MAVEPGGNKEGVQPSMEGESPTAPSQERSVAIRFAPPGQPPVVSNGWLDALAALSARSAARQVYREAVVYHATSRAAKDDIRSNGFQLSRKTAGATSRGSVPDAQASSFHYLMQSRTAANAFADLHLPQVPHALVRVLGAGTAFPVEPDERTDDRFGALRTASDIGRELVLGSKRSPPGEDAEAFRRQLSEAGCEVDRDRAGELLREVQSDSEDDLPEDYYE